MMRSSWSNPSSASQPAPRILTMRSSRIASANGPGAGAAAAGGGAGAGGGAEGGGATACGGGGCTQANSNPDNSTAAIFPFIALLLLLERLSSVPASRPVGCQADVEQQRGHSMRAESGTTLRRKSSDRAILRSAQENRGLD